LSGGVDDAKDWFDKRTKSSFDVIFVPSGELVKILTQEQINIDYDTPWRQMKAQIKMKLSVGIALRQLSTHL
jgi:hypothetical protein